MSFSAYKNEVDAAIERQKDRPGALLPLLHDIQDQLGHVPTDALPQIAKALNLSRADVHGVVSFYHHFRAEKPGRYVLRVCRAEACQAMGSEQLLDHVLSSLKTKLGETTQDNRITVEAVYCLGNCACSPAVMVGDDLHGRVTPERFDAIVKALV